jgi:hypothetical protein
MAQKKARKIKVKVRDLKPTKDAKGGGGGKLGQGSGQINPTGSGK